MILYSKVLLSILHLFPLTLTINLQRMWYYSLFAGEVTISCRGLGITKFLGH